MAVKYNFYCCMLTQFLVKKEIGGRLTGIFWQVTANENGFQLRQCVTFGGATSKIVFKTFL